MLVRQLMNNVTQIHNKLLSLLNEQNNFNVEFDVNMINDNELNVNIKSLNSFLQINNLDYILQDSEFNIIHFNINDDSTLNIQNFEYSYYITSAKRCLIHSFNLSKINRTDIQLDSNCTCIYKGPHNIKTGKDCVIENALKSS